MIDALINSLEKNNYQVTKLSDGRLRLVRGDVSATVTFDDPELGDGAKITPKKKWWGCAFRQASDICAAHAASLPA